MFPRRIDGLTVVALGLMAFMALNVLQDRVTIQTAQAAAGPTITPVVMDIPAQAQAIDPVVENDPNVGGGILLAENDPAQNGGVSDGETGASPEDAAQLAALSAAQVAAAFIAPYDSYYVTQGLHGYNYGHAAVDLSAGDGEVILSPISGVISELYIDEWGNTTLVVENETYQVTFLHGLYTVSEGDQVQIGDPIGTESNQGNTYGADGNYCGAGSACGFHTHLNVFDKILGDNVNPLELMEN